MITGLSRLDFMVYSDCHYLSPRDRLGPSLFVLSAPGPQRQEDNRVYPLRLYQLLLQQDRLLVLHPLSRPRHPHHEPHQHRGQSKPVPRFRFFAKSDNSSVRLN